MERYDTAGKKLIDDFTWDTYTADYYLKETQAALARGEAFLIDKTTIDDGVIVWRENIHPHAKALLDDILGCAGIKSVMEIGCAGGHNLYCISKLFPNIKTYGVDISTIQNVVMAAFHGLSGKEIGFKEIDYSKPGAYKKGPTADFVFTNAVIMHLSYGAAVEFIKNIVLGHPDHIRLTEDFSQHDIKKLLADSGADGKYRYTIKNQYLRLWRIQ